MNSASFPKQARLRSRPEFDRVFKNVSQKLNAGGITVLASRNQSCGARLGLAIAKKALPTAVARNRVKRLVRESFRCHYNELNNWDIIVLAQRQILQKDNRQILATLSSHWHRLGRL